MSYINGPHDQRAHTTPREKERHAEALVAKVRALITEDQPDGVPACNECAVVTLMLALGALAAEIAASKDTDEMFGSARRFADFQDICEHVRETLLAAASNEASPLEVLLRGLERAAQRAA